LFKKNKKIFVKKGGQVMFTKIVSSPLTKVTSFTIDKKKKPVYSFSLETLLKEYQTKKISKQNLSKWWEQCWGNEVKGTYITHKNQNVFHIIQDMLEDYEIEDCMASIYLNLETGEFTKPIKYVMDEDKLEKKLKRYDNDPEYMIVFAK
jgi:hypothetical protein